MIELSLEAVASYALTWLLHLLALLALAALARRALAREHVAAREAWLKAALLGAPLTALAQLAWIEAPLGGTIFLARDARASSAAPRERSSAVELGVEQPSSVRDALAHAEEELPTAPEDASPLPSAGLEGTETLRLEPLVAAEQPPRTSLAFLAFALWSLVALALLARHGVRRWRLSQALAHREPVADGPARDLLDALCLEAGFGRGVLLSRSRALRVPVAFGWLRPEICVPASFFDELEEAAWEPLLAHELAHLVRRDPLWLALCRAQAALTLGLPPLRWAERALRADAEWLADAWAAQRTSPLELARCLACVAERTLHARAPRGAFALAGHEEPTLTRRVERLLAPGEVAHAAHGVRGARLAALALCGALALGAPALRSAPPSELELERAASPASPEDKPSSSSSASATHAELRLLERELAELEERVRGTSLEAELAPQLALWAERIELLRAELSLASLPQSVRSNPSR
ncbi:MAG: M56 family metallopeptidase [Planctomycetes bacterium]|nr:M56 family metallopeptidase [Planctomycetota bacterium]